MEKGSAALVDGIQKLGLKVSGKTVIIGHRSVQLAVINSIRKVGVNTRAAKTTRDLGFDST
eukprot:3739238-Pyramimonas_sp.AAC.1